MILFLLPVYFKGINLRYYFIIISPLVLFAPFASISIYLYDFLPSKLVMLSVLQTNLHETSEFLSGIEVVFFIFLLALSVYFWIVFKKIPKCWTLKKSTVVYSLSGFSVFFILIFAGLSYTNGTKKILHQFYSNVLYLSYPIGVIHNTVEAYDYLSYDNVTEKEVFNALDISESSDQKICVFVLGESSRYDNWQVNGYHRSTSPNLASIDNLVVMADMISTAPTTGLSLPLILTRAKASVKRFDPGHSFLTALKQAGYKVSWLTNQVLEQSTVPYINEADNYENISEKDQYDDQLLQLLKKELIETDSNLFVVLHTKGNHFDYDERYPIEFDHFKPSTKKETFVSRDIANKELYINSYDNSILYTDYFISEVIKSLDLLDKEVVSSVFYVSDHGEILFDHGRNKMGHGIGVVDRNLYHIPCFVWLSDAFVKARPGKYHYLKENAGKAASTENIFDTILDLNDIQIDQGLGSSLTREYVPQKRYVLINNDSIADYDLIIR
nr:phosphoethanolamine transferase [Fulvivirga sp. M361]